MMNFFKLAILSMALPSLSYAQNDAVNFCGTTEVDPWLKHYFENRSVYATESADTIFVPLTIHILGNDDGQGYYPIHTLYESLCTLNEDFSASGIQFYIQEPINYINRSVWYDHPSFGAGIDMMQANNVYGTANCYFVANPAGNCGYYASRGNAIALSKGCSDPSDHTWAHELGHFFSLPHTFVGWEGVRWEQGKSAKDYEGDVRRSIETVDGSNCSSAADGFCDTPPDYLSYRWNCNGNQTSNEVMIDPDSVKFQSDGSLFMSYANDACMNRFSFEQNEAMKANINFQRSELITNSFPSAILPVTAPQNPFPTDTLLVNPDNAFASWDIVDGASHYIIELSRLPNFGYILARERIESNFYNFPELIPGIRYYWRVKAVNSNSFCTNYTDTNIFITSKTSGSTAQFEDDQLALAKTHYQTNEALSIISKLSNPLNAEWKIFNMNAQVLAKGQVDLSSGSERTVIHVPIGLVPGQYVIQFESSENAVAHRFVVIP